MGVATHRLKAFRPGAKPQIQQSRANNLQDDDMMISLERRAYSGYGPRPMIWASCLPFVRNNIGKLIHRPRYGSTFLKHGCIPEHFAIEYHCGQSCSDRVGSGKLEVIEAPDTDEIVCHRCESFALQRGLPSSEEITGNHVHIGSTKAVKNCCGGEHE